jgi:hypothetical protein
MQLKEAGLTADNHNVDNSSSGVLASPASTRKLGKRAKNILRMEEEKGVEEEGRGGANKKRNNRGRV